MDLGLEYDESASEAVAARLSGLNKQVEELQEMMKRRDTAFSEMDMRAELASEYPSNNRREVDSSVPKDESEIAKNADLDGLKAQLFRHVTPTPIPGRNKDEDKQSIDLRVVRPSPQSALTENPNAGKPSKPGNENAYVQERTQIQKRNFEDGVVEVEAEIERHAMALNRAQEAHQERCSEIMKRYAVGGNVRG